MVDQWSEFVRWPLTRVGVQEARGWLRAGLVACSQDVCARVRVRPYGEREALVRAEVRVSRSAGGASRRRKRAEMRLVQCALRVAQWCIVQCHWQVECVACAARADGVCVGACAAAIGNAHTEIVVVVVEKKHHAQCDVEHQKQLMRWA